MIDWFAVSKRLGTKPEVVQMADILEIPRQHVTGCLIDIWGWAIDNVRYKDVVDFPCHASVTHPSHIGHTSVTHLSRDGHAYVAACPGTEHVIDVVAERDGFAQAMQTVGWLAVVDGYLIFPGFERYEPQLLKKQALARDRQRTKRASEAPKKDGKSCHASVTHPSHIERDKKRTTLHYTTLQISPPNPPKGEPGSEGEKKEEQEEGADRLCPDNERNGAVKECLTTGDAAAGGNHTTDGVAEEIFAAYPRDAARERALVEIRAALQTVNADTLLGAVKRYAASKEIQDKLAVGDQRHIPYAATWCREQRYDEWKEDQPVPKFSEAESNRRAYQRKEQLAFQAKFTRECEHIRAWLAGMKTEKAQEVRDEAWRRMYPDERDSLKLWCEENGQLPEHAPLSLDNRKVCPWWSSIREAWYRLNRPGWTKEDRDQYDG